MKKIVFLHLTDQTPTCEFTAARGRSVQLWQSKRSLQLLPRTGCELFLIILFWILFFFMAHAMPSHASAAHLWLLSTLSCPASSVLPLVMSYSVLSSPPLSCWSTASLVFPYSWLHEHSRCMLSWDIFHLASGSNVQFLAIPNFSVASIVTVSVLTSNHCYRFLWLINYCFIDSITSRLFIPSLSCTDLLAKLFFTHWLLEADKNIDWFEIIIIYFVY